MTAQMFNAVTTRRKVFKMRTCAICRPAHAGEKFWVAIHPSGPKRFDTWREAYDYARSPLILMNILMN